MAADIGSDCVVTSSFIAKSHYLRFATRRLWGSRVEVFEMSVTHVSRLLANRTSELTLLDFALRVDF